MGLSIRSKSENTYDAPYSALHRVRYMAYAAAGGREDYVTYHKNYTSDTVERAFMDANLAYPNLMWHSDCDGTYTPDGKVGSYIEVDNLMTGNSVELLAELKDITERLQPENHPVDNEYDWNTMTALYDIVEDTVENYDGVLEFS